MGFSLPRKLKDNFLTRGASRAFDQVNPFDNNRTWQQRTPTQSKSTVQQIGQLGGQTARAVGGGTARLLNTTAAAISEIPATVRGEVAMRTGNQKALSNALTAQRNMRDQLYGTQNQGLLGRGTIFKSPEERLTASPADVIKRVGGAVAESGLEVVSAGMGGVAGKTIARQGIRQGLKTQLPTIGKNALLNTAQGGVNAYNQGASGKDILKSAAIGGTVGTVADVGLGLASAGVSRAAKSKIKPVEAMYDPKIKAAQKQTLESIAEKPKVAFKPKESVEKAVYGKEIPTFSNEAGKSKVFGVSRKPGPIVSTTRAIQRGAQNIVEKGLSSNNKAAYIPARALQTVFGGSSWDDDLLSAVGQMKGGSAIAGNMKDTIDAQVKKMMGGKIDDASRKAIVEALDPAIAAQRGVSVKLTPEQATATQYLRRVLDAGHDKARALGVIDEVAYESNKGSYLPRLRNEYEFPDDMKQYMQRNGFKMDDSLAKARKDIAKTGADNIVNDPVYLVGKQIDFLNRFEAIQDFGKYLNTRPDILSITPKTGFVQLGEGKLYGDLANKYVRRDVYESIMGFGFQNEHLANLYKMGNAWERNAVRRGRKKLMTVYNPVVQLGNATYNYVRALQAGVDPVTLSATATKALKEGTSGTDFLMLKKAGVLGTDIGTAEIGKTAKRIATGQENKGLRKTIAGALGVMDDKVVSVYQGADDYAKVAFYKAIKSKGFSEQEALKRTRDYFQNYDLVGKSWDISAKVPVFGKAFGRFTGDFIRTTTNTFRDHPLTAVGLIAGWKMFGDYMSEQSGEAPEDKATREGRMGAGKIPFTDISTEIQTPFGAVDVRRFLGPSVLNSPEGGTIGKSLEGLSPFPNPIETTDDGKRVNASAAGSDPLIGPLVQMGMDRDFRGKSISDPEGTDATIDELSGEEKLKNRLKFINRSYSPELVNSGKDVVDAFKGREDYYGRERTPGQAVAKALGVRTEKYDAERAQKQRDTDAYFNDKKSQDAVVAKLPKEYQEAYKRATGYYKTRENVANEFEPGSTRKKKAEVYNFPEEKWKDFASSPELYNAVLRKKTEDAKRSGAPIQPEFDDRLSLEFRKQLINNKSLAPGEDVEADERMYSMKEWDSYQKIKDEYTAKAKKYYPEKDGEFDDETVRHTPAKFPEKPAAYKAYTDAYTAYSEGKGAKPAFNDAIAAAKEQYSKAKLDWTNKERKARGLPPISPEVWDNVTFGFTPDEEKVYNQLKYGRGYGGGSGGGSGGSSGVSFKKATVPGAKALEKVSLKSSAPEIRTKKSVKRRPRPKIQLKKSMV